jgi:hypothetical protein
MVSGINLHTRTPPVVGFPTFFSIAHCIYAHNSVLIWIINLGRISRVKLAKRRGNFETKDREERAK